MPAPKIGTGVIDVAFDPKQIEQAGKEQILPSAKRIAGDVALAFAGAALLKVGVQGLDELKQAAAAQSNVESVIRSTGGAAGVSADQVDELANSQLKLTGVDDEVIKQGAAKLLTFKQVANQVGAGNDVFDRATKLSLDLAQVGFGSVESASVLLGKALNDPVKGLTALQRVGVSLTDGQKEQVKAFVASGDVLSAQKVILGEVESQVGGAAEAYGKTLPGKIDIARQSLDNMKGDLVAAEAPLIELGAQGVTFLTEKLQELPEGAQAAVGGVVLFGGAVGTLVRPVGDAIRLYDRFREGQEAAGTAAQAAAAVQVGAAETVEAGVGAAEVRRIVTNEALTFSEQEIITAQAARLLSNDALIASEEAVDVANAAAAAENEALAASQLGLATGASAGVGALGAVSIAAAGVAISIGAVSAIRGVFDDPTEGANDYTQAILAAKQATDATAESIDVATNKVTAGKLATDENAQAAADAGVSWLSMGGEISASTDDLDHWQRVSRTAGTDVHALADNLRDAGAGGTEFGRGLIDALDAGNLTTEQARRLIERLYGLRNGLAEGKTQADAQAAALTGIVGPAADAKGGLDGVNAAAAEGPDSEHAKALATMLETIAKNADNAFAATLKLAPADIRAREGRIAIADANDKVTEAETKLDYLRKAKADPKKIADAERDLEKARLDQQTAVLNEADALAELANQQQIAATGTAMSAEETDRFTQGALTLLNTQLTGPTHEAIAGYIWDMEVARQKVDAWKAAQEAATNFTPPTADIGKTPDGGFDPRLVPPSGEPRRSTGVPGARAAGGPVGSGEIFRGAEQGYELLLTEGLYQAPPSGGHVLNHQQSVDFMGGRSAPSGTSGVHIDQVIVQGEDAPKALRRLPDELRAAAFLATV